MNSAALGLNSSNPEQRFADAMLAAGMPTPDRILADGVLHRFATKQKAGDDAGWYCLFAGEISVGFFGDWRTGESHTWRENIGRRLTPAEETALKKQADTARQQRKADKEKRHRETATLAQLIWEEAKPVISHPYLMRKNIGPLGIRMMTGDRVRATGGWVDLNGELLVIPVRGPDDALRGLQFIDGAGGKKFLSGTAKTGGYFTIGEPGKHPLCIVEGFATGASVHAATGWPVAVAFDAGNLKPVAEAQRNKHPKSELLICGDTDLSGTGQRAATEAANAVNGRLALTGSLETCDFNDLAVAQGLEAVRQTMEATLQPCEELSAAGPGIKITRGDAIKLEPIDWLWPGWLAAGKFHLLAGQAGTGKTSIAISLAAELSRGGEWPDGSPAAIGATLIWSGEDSPSDSLLPRFLANNGDSMRVFFVDHNLEADRSVKPFDPATDIVALADRAREIENLRLIIIDPVVSAVAGDSHRNAEVRRALQPIVDLARQLGAAVLGITHYSKGTAGRDPAERVTGSLAFGALARVVMGTAKPTKGGQLRRLVRAKSNIGPDGGGFEYELRQEAVEGNPEIFGQRVVWGADLEGTARELLAEVEGGEKASNAPEREGGERWLSELLKGGPVAAKDIKAWADAEGRTMRTLKRAKANLKIVSRKTEFGSGWVWELPKGAEISQE